MVETIEAKQVSRAVYPVVFPGSQGGSLMHNVADNHDDEELKVEVSEEIDALTDEYTLYE